MTNNWLNIYHQYNTDLTKHEVILIGERNGVTILWTYQIPESITEMEFSKFIKNLNEQLDVVCLDPAFKN